jgi:hypothetical protein
MKIKIYIFSIILILFFSKITNANPLKTIQNCADQKGTDEQLIYLSNWQSLNSYHSLLKKHSTNWYRHREIVEIIEEELKYLSEINFTELQNKYLRYSSNLPYLRTLWWTYYDAVKWADDNENDRLNKRIRSNFFKDHAKTKSNLERKLRNHKTWANQEKNETYKLKEIGKKKYNIKFNKTYDEKKKNMKKFLNQSLKVKLQNEKYETYFSECEKERVKAPITFDNKWN